MSNQTPQNRLLKIAAPYYGTLNHPVHGLSSLYFLLEVQADEKKIAHMHVSVWNRADGSQLGGWLKEMGASALFCSTIDTDHHMELAASGIRVESIACGDIIDGIRAWLKESHLELLEFIEPMSRSIN